MATQTHCTCAPCEPEKLFHSRKIVLHRKKKETEVLHEQKLESDKKRRGGRSAEQKDKERVECEAPIAGG